MSQQFPGFQAQVDFQTAVLITVLKATSLKDESQNQSTIMHFKDKANIH